MGMLGTVDNNSTAIVSHSISNPNLTLVCFRHWPARLNARGFDSSRQPRLTNHRRKSTALLPAMPMRRIQLLAKKVSWIKWNSISRP